MFRRVIRHGFPALIQQNTDNEMMLSVLVADLRMSSLSTTPAHRAFIGLTSHHLYIFPAKGSNAVKFTGEQIPAGAMVYPGGHKIEIPIVQLESGPPFEFLPSSIWLFVDHRDWNPAGVAFFTALVAASMNWGNPKGILDATPDAVEIARNLLKEGS